MSTPIDDALVQRAAASVDRATGLALQADSASAAQELARIPANAFDAEAATFRDCMIRRFGLDGVAPHDFGIEDAWVAELVNAYVTYWQQVLAQRVPVATAEVALQAAVGALLVQLRGKMAHR